MNVEQFFYLLEFLIIQKIITALMQSEVKEHKKIPKNSFITK